LPRHGHRHSGGKLGRQRVEVFGVECVEHRLRRFAWRLGARRYVAQFPHRSPYLSSDILVKGIDNGQRVCHDEGMKNLTDIAATITAEWVAAHEDQFSPSLEGDEITVDDATVFVSTDRTEAFVWAGNDIDPDMVNQIRVAL
jgi:hypothetical protein